MSSKSCIVQGHRGVLQHVDASVLERRGALGTDQQQVVRVEVLHEPAQ